jgi:PKD repeat protein
MAVSKISSLDPEYVSGDLSLYSEAKDSRDGLYDTKNNSETILTQSLTYNGKLIIVEDTSSFPDRGLLRIGPKAGKPGPAELVYYDNKTNTIFKDLIRGFAGSRQNQWDAGNHVTSGVMAEHHNALKDAVINIEHNLGLKDDPTPESLNGMLKDMETRFLAPKPLFRAFPLKGPPPLKVRFQNFTLGSIKSLWDFGDGTQSFEKSPIHTYQSEGVFTVKLNIVTSLGAQGVSTKNNYILVDNEEAIPFFYVQPKNGISVEKAAELTAMSMPTSPTIFEFVDQTDEEITQRFWVFDDGNTLDVSDPNIHTATHVYQSAGEYSPSLLIVSKTKLKRLFLADKILVI